MTNNILITIIFCIILGAMLYTGVIKTVKINFKPAPVENTYQRPAPGKTQSERAAELEEKNRRMMERVQRQMEKMKH
jgi:hypothetical protein